MPASDTAESASGVVNDTPTTPSNRSSWFTDLRAKLNQFHALDFFSNLGFASKQQNADSSGGARKTSIRGGTSESAAALTSRSVMNLSTNADEAHSSSVRPNDKFLSTINSNVGTGSEIAASVRHHSDEPRRRLFVNSASTAQKNEEPEPIWRVKQKSEPPNFGSTGKTGRGGQHDDEEKPSAALVHGEYDGATATLERVDVDLVSACDMNRFGTLSGLIPIGKKDPGVGHAFEFAPAGYPTWCDKCGDFISGLNEGQAVRCKNCRFTCHVQCQPLVTLDCRSSTNSLKSEASSADRPTIETENVAVAMESGDVRTSPNRDRESLVETETTELNDIDTEEICEVLDEITSSDEIQRDLPRGEKLRRLIEEYNRHTADGLAMTLEDDGITFRGFLQIHMNFSRPINVIAGEHPPSIYDVLVSEGDPDSSLTDYAASLEGRKTITSFYLPRNTVKVLHITSETTTSEMIVSLLRKFKVADNPRKFSLYERDLEPGKTLQARLLRIPEEACPLRLALFWGCKRKAGRFVLQENETGDIMWEAFEIPELQNFLKILDIEESQYVKQIEHRYHVYRYWLEAEIRHRLATRTAASASRTTDNDTAVDEGEAGEV